jgi:hypothetical protein
LFSVKTVKSIKIPISVQNKRPQNHPLLCCWTNHVKSIKPPYMFCYHFMFRSHFHVGSICFFLVFCSHNSLSNMYRVLTVVTPFMERYSSHRKNSYPPVN